MGNSSQPSVVYEGDLLVTDFDTENLADLEAVLEDFVDLEEGEELYVSAPQGERLEVAKLRERRE